MLYDNNINVILDGAADYVLDDELINKLKNPNFKMNVKIGCDPTAPDLHLGHYVVLKKLKALQDANHKIFFLIGDFTARIGDPTGKSVTRPSLTEEEIISNANTYKEQVAKILDVDRLNVCFNSAWLNKLSSHDMIKLAASTTVARMLEREDFKKRFNENKSISIHEFLYPLLQGYDSYELNTDLELGGTDQKFNLLTGREIQEYYGKAKQSILMMPLLEGTDGIQKMSKSLGNYIEICGDYNDMFGKIMSISDELMWKYYLLLSNEKTKTDIVAMQNECNQGGNPMNYKLNLAHELVKTFHGIDLAELAYKNFKIRFQEKNIAYDLAEINLQTNEDVLFLTDILKNANLVSSKTEAKRLIDAGAVKVDDCKVSDANIKIKSGTKITCTVGKHRGAIIHIVKTTNSS